MKLRWQVFAEPVQKPQGGWVTPSGHGNFQKFEPPFHQPQGCHLKLSEQSPVQPVLGFLRRPRLDGHPARNRARVTESR